MSRYYSYSSFWKHITLTLPASFHSRDSRNRWLWCIKKLVVTFIWRKSTKFWEIFESLTVTENDVWKIVKRENCRIGVLYFQALYKIPGSSNDWNLHDRDFYKHGASIVINRITFPSLCTTLDIPTNSHPTNLSHALHNAGGKIRTVGLVPYSRPLDMDASAGSTFAATHLRRHPQDDLEDALFR